MLVGCGLPAVLAARLLVVFFGVGGVRNDWQPHRGLLPVLQIGTVPCVDIVSLCVRCHFSQMLHPVFNSAAADIRRKFPVSGDSDELFLGRFEDEICVRFTSLIVHIHGRSPYTVTQWHSFVRLLLRAGVQPTLDPSADTFISVQCVCPGRGGELVGVCNVCACCVGWRKEQ